MFSVNKVRVANESHNILDVDFCNNFNNESDNNITTLLLGENGVGKSFLLKTIIDIFLFLENAQVYKRKPKFYYKEFEIDYTIDKNSYHVIRRSGRELEAKLNNVSIDYKNLILPSRILAFAFMVNDKFPYFKENESSIYFYHGVRSSSNSTYTSSVSRRLTFDLLEAINKSYFSQIKEVLSVLNFEPYIFLKLKNSEEEKIDLSSLDISLNMKYNEHYYPTISFVKKGQKIGFDSCSSGEKHLLFTFIGIINQIKNNSIVIIDEPEISLHPEWQTRYISILNGIASQATNCHFVLASHSHYFVSGIKADQSSICIVKQNRNDNGFCTTGSVLPYDTYSWSAENIIYNVFGIRTTRNYYFEQDLNELINMLQNYDKKEKQKVQNRIAKFKQLIIDSNDPLIKIVEEAEEIVNDKS